MSTLSMMDSHSPWSNAKDIQSLKRRHIRGSTANSHTSLRAASLSPPPSYPYKHNTADEDLYRIDSPANTAQPSSNKGVKHVHGKDADDFDKSSQATGVPSWFGSLRSFAISATSNSRGAFAPLDQTPTSRRTSSISAHSSSRGRSSSIYYACAIDGDDSDSDYGSENNDEPITSKNGLKENKVRGPRMSWAALDPSLGGLFPQSYKSVPGSDAEPSSPSGSSAASSLHSPTFSNIEDLGITDVPYRDDNNDDNLEHSRAEPYAAYPQMQEDPSVSADMTSWRNMASPDRAQSPTTLSSGPASAMSFIKSYVPSLPSFHDADVESAETLRTASKANTGSSFWSFRKISMNLMSGGNQYASIGTGAETRDESIESINSGSSYRDDVEEREGESSSNNSFSSDKSVAQTSSPPTSYFGSILNSASSAVAAKSSQYISSNMRDNLEHLPINSKSLKKIGRTD
ncbi:hypothetical protein BGZ98_004398 [Dissophora globulifera]|nr:hypothetical protein BGZ98_004398 [Dissophora globulifera]